MMAALALYLLWNSRSPFNAPTTILGGNLPPLPSEDTPVGPSDPTKWIAPDAGATLIALGASLTYAVWSTANGGVVYADPQGHVVGVERYGATVNPNQEGTQR